MNEKQKEERSVIAGKLAGVAGRLYDAEAVVNGLRGEPGAEKISAELKALYELLEKAHVSAMALQNKLFID